jgi:hypothetical protein
LRGNQQLLNVRRRGYPEKANYIIKTEISRPHMIAPKDFSHTQSEQRKPKTIVPSDTLGRPKSNPLGF